jgi:hypothetical protein
VCVHVGVHAILIKCSTIQEISAELERKTFSFLGLGILCISPFPYRASVSSSVKWS